MNIARRGNHSVFMAVDKRSRYAGYSYCPGEPASCIDARGNVPGGTAVEVCNQGGKYDCALYAIEHVIVWDGPIYVLNLDPLQKVPFNGIWPFQLTKPDGGQGELRATEGQLAVTSPRLGQNCPMQFQPTGSLKGNFTIACNGGVKLEGRYVSSDGQTIKGEGFDSFGRDWRFTLDMARGRSNAGDAHF